jgi:hypothetical protein
MSPELLKEHERQHHAMVVRVLHLLDKKEIHKALCNENWRFRLAEVMVDLKSEFKTALSH